MIETIARHPGAVLAGLSGILLVVLGVAALRIRPRTPAVWGFAAFGALWGVEVIAANAARVWADPAGAVPLYLAFIALVIPIHLPLLYLASVHPWKSNALGKHRAALWAAAAPSAILLLLLAAAPELFVRGVRPTASGLNAPLVGALFGPVTTGNAVLAFAVALWIVHRKLRHAPSATARSQLHLVSLAFLPYVTYRGVQVTGTLLLVADRVIADRGFALYSLELAMGVAALAAAGLVAVGALRDPTHPHRRAALLAWGLPLLVAALETFLQPPGSRRIDTVGIWRFLMVGTFAYGIARYRLFDLEMRLRPVLPVGAFLAGSIIGLEILWNALGPSFDSSPGWAALATLGFELLVLAIPLTIRRRWPSLVGKATDAPRLELRRREVYQAALEGALLDGVITQREEDILRHLRRSLGITEEEHARLLAETAPHAPAPAVAERAA